jgi:hypothetical protein
MKEGREGFFLKKEARTFVCFGAWFGGGGLVP